MRILILAALPEEADAFRPGEGAPIDLVWPPTRRLALGDHDVIVATSGIGKVNMSAAAASLIVRHAPDLLLVIGTAGKLSSIEGDCFWLAHAVQHDYGAKQTAGFIHYDPGAWPMGPASITPFAALPDPGLGLPHATIVSGDAFVEDGAFAGHLVVALGGDVVDMETAAIGQVAQALALPWAAIKATTDDANHESAGDFHANLRAASRRAAEAAERLIALLPAENP